MNKGIRFKGFLDFYLRWPYYLFLLLAVGSIGVFCVNKQAGLISFIVDFVYLLVAWLIFYTQRNRFVDEMISFATNYGQVQKKIMMDMMIPYALIDRSGRFLWMNKLFMDIIGKNKDYHKCVSTIFAQVIPERFPSEDQVREFFVSRDGRDYRMQLKPLSVDELTEDSQILEIQSKQFSMLAVYLMDITELNSYIQKNQDEKLVTGLVYIDNYEEAMESVDEVRRSLLTALIERRINKYFLSNDAIVKKLEKDKFFVVMQKKTLTGLQQKKFDVLEEVKAVNIGNDMSVTLSIGIGENAPTMIQNSEYARVAIELALGRGGDQVVVKSGEELAFYGGKSQHAEKNTRVKARVKAHALREIMNHKERILIMGHSLPDVDALGSGIGIYRAARTLGKQAHIVVEHPTTAIRPLMDAFIKDKEYGGDMFVSGHDAKEMVNMNTMLVVVDTNRPSYTECEELLYMVETIVVLDHHRQGGEIIQNAALSYIEPYASSASEMVAEILQYFDDSIHIRNIEADSLYAGIMVDTDNFLTKTGVRTFEAAAFLRRNGADITRIRKMFREDMKNLQAKGQTISETELYDKYYAISVCPTEGIESPTIVGAQAANEMLNIKGVKASFVLTLFKDTVYISARAIDEVNVQIIMERLGGGGHLNVAGAQLKGKSIAEARMLLKTTLKEMTDGGEI